jgi:hypothetical protein
MERHSDSITRAPRIRLRQLLVVIAVLAVVLAVSVPIVKRTFFPETWNTWIVKTIERPDGSIVRLRIRRYPHRDVVFEEILKPPRRAQPEPGSPRTPAHATAEDDPS